MIKRLNRMKQLPKMGVMFKRTFAPVLMRSGRRFELALLVGLVLIGPIMAFSYYSLRQLDEARRVQEHSLIVREHLNDLRAAVRQYEIHDLRSDSDAVRAESRKEVETVLDELSRSVDADEIQGESMIEVHAAISDFIQTPNELHAKDVREWIASMDAQEAYYLNQHRPVAVAFLSKASGSILLVGILSLFLSILAFIGLRRQMRSREIIEAELRVAERQATRASEMKSKFLATISHEIRTPLNGIIAIADVLRTSTLPAKEKRLVDVVFQSSQSLLRIIQDLLNFSQIEAGQVGLEVEVFSIQALVEQTCLVLDFKAQSKNIFLRYSMGPEVPECVEGDGGRLGQVLFNLIGNAIKFTSTGSVEVKVEQDPASDASVARINFSVSDSGLGISAEDLGTLFQPFNRLGKVGTGGEPGTGLGLSISQSLVRQMGGEIRVESRVGQGAVFWFQLPLKMVKPASVVVDDGVVTTVPAARLEGSFNDARFGGIRVLVAEDNPTNQIVAQVILEKLGCQVSLAATGLEAVELIAAREFDLILMDCQMPMLDGYEATRRIRSFERTTGRRPVRIAAMTANAQADDRARCLASGMDEYVLKPFVVEDLVCVLEGGEFQHDLSTIERAIENLRVRLGSMAVSRIRHAFLNSLDSWPLEEHRLAGDVEYLKDLAHKLKASAKTIGARGFAERLEYLEGILKKSDSAMTLTEVVVPVDVLKSELDRDVRSLKRHFKVELEVQN